ncbi:MAG TPA: hypothetical protein VKD24_05930 [Candidatus Angelobacter sp.]|nr:hypothetical protein [Candidatus Angelobacter sp.]
MAKVTKNSQNEVMLQVPIDRDLHKKFKLKCLALDTTMAKQIERLIEVFLKGKTHEERA